jgi:predicted nucleic acid-binding Zn ribbon protein
VPARGGWYDGSDKSTLPYSEDDNRRFGSNDRCCISCVNKERKRKRIKELGIQDINALTVVVLWTREKGGR